MRLLLDTHIWLWFLMGSPQIQPRIREALESEENSLWLSPISIWESGALARKGRLELPCGFPDWLDEALRAWPVREAPVNFHVATKVFSLHLPHRDPADHFLAATALVFDLTLVTADRHLLEAPEVPTL